MRWGRLARNTLLVAVFFGVDKLLALVRTILVARTFQLSPEMDAFNAANNIPDMLFALISGGALAMAFIPVLSEVLVQEGRPAMWGLFSRIANLAFLVTAGLSILVGVEAPYLVATVIAPGFPPALQALTVELMRLDLLALLIFSLSGLVSAGLYANQHFLLPALAPLLYNVGQIIGVVFLAPRFGIFGLVYGVLLGAGMHLGIQIPGLVKYGFRWLPRIELRHPRVVQVLRLLGPRVVTMFFIQTIFIARDYLASFLPLGAVTALAYGWFIMQVPETILGTAVGLVLLPTLSETWARGDREGFARTLNRGIRTVFAFNLTAAALLAAVLPKVLPILGLNFEDTQLVVATARAYLAGMVGHALLELTARGFYAQQDAKTPLLASAINTAMYITFALLFGRLLAAVGIALANSTAFTLEALLLLFLMRRRVAGILDLRGTWWRTLTAMALSAGFILLMERLMPTAPWWHGLFWSLAAVLLVLPVLWPEIRGFLRA